MIRLVTLAGGAEITPENARFFAAPLPVVLHIVGAGTSFPIDWEDNAVGPALREGGPRLASLLLNMGT